MPATATRMTTEEQLAEHVARLARKTEALDDFAGLVAHDVKSSLLGRPPRRGSARGTDARARARRLDPRGGARGSGRHRRCATRGLRAAGDRRPRRQSHRDRRHRQRRVPDATGRPPSRPAEPACERDRGRCGADSRLGARARRSAHARRRRRRRRPGLDEPLRHGSSDLGCACAVASSNGAAACSSSGRARSAERAQ